MVGPNWCKFNVLWEYIGSPPLHTFRHPHYYLLIGLVRPLADFWFHSLILIRHETRQTIRPYSWKMSSKKKSGFQKRKERQERQRKQGEGKQLLTDFFPKKGEPRMRKLTVSNWLWNQIVSKAVSQDDMGGAVVWWLALSPHNTKVLGSNPGCGLS